MSANQSYSHQKYPPAPAGSQAALVANLGALRILKLREVAKLLSVSTVTVRRRVHDGSLPGIRLKGRLYFQPEEVRIFLMKNAAVLWAPSGD